jgi:hypothetical protein
MSARNGADFHGLTAHATDIAMAANVGAIVAACIAAADAVLVAADALRRALPPEDASCPGHPLP